MSRKLNTLIEQKKKKGEKLLSVFITAGFPEKSDTVDIILALDQAGVDFIELGIPFSDPIADGPVIQTASQRALDNGVTLTDVFGYVQKVRNHTEIPILLMGYLNPVFHFGIEKAMDKSIETGVDGWIIPDWSLEESMNYLPKLSQHNIDMIHLIAPNTSLERIRSIDQLSTSFIYCVAYTGVTGKDNRPTPQTLSFFREIRKLLQHPLMIGFGIKSHQDYLTYTAFSEGVIIGSAFIKMIETSPRKDFSTEIRKFIRNIRNEI
jgi:tryptophan synthase alpha chain